jgi:hypothetical protein
MASYDLLANVTCSSTRHPGVGRFRQVGRDWELVGVSRQRPGSVLPPGGPSTTAAMGAFTVTKSYPGCPSCHADNFVRCGRCQCLACWDTTWPTFSCPSCGNSGPVEGSITEISSLEGR